MCGWSAAGLLAIGLGLPCCFAPMVLDSKYNATFDEPPPPVSAEVEALHAELIVADLHSDALLWNRDPLNHNRRGHVDLPRLQEGGVALQGFTIVTRVPAGASFRGTRDRCDAVTPLVMAQGWRPATWGSTRARVLYQAERLHDAAERSDGQLAVVTSVAELDDLLARQAQGEQVVGGFLGIEGAHALEGDLNNVDRFFQAGVRMMAPTHFHDNDIAGSAHGVERGGLTDLGRAMLARMEELGMVLDLAHASPPTIAEATELVQSPVVVSHTGVRGTCDTDRNLSDDEVRAVAETGGLIGIGFWPDAVCGEDVASIARALRYVADLVGVEHAALGSDFDGMVSTPIDASGMAAITAALLDEGLTQEEVARIMGGNVVRVLRQTLPPSP